MKAIFDLCNKYYLRSKSIEKHPDKDVFLEACIKNIKCPYKYETKKVPVKMFSSSGTTIEHHCLCSYNLENKC